MNLNGYSIIHPGAQIGENVIIGPFSSVEEDVVIGDNVWIDANVSIKNGVRIGNHCKIFAGAIIGSIPQDLKYKGEKTFLEIGDHTTIREYCTLNIGTNANRRTRIGAHCLLMAYVHIAHDCTIGDRVVLANNVTLAGHIEIGAHATLGGLVAVHQFVKIGEHAMVGGGSLVRSDVPPFVTAAREPLSYAGVNSTGLKRRGFTIEQVNQISDVYRLLFIKGFNTRQALKRIEETLPASPEKDRIVQFIRAAKRGLIKGFRTIRSS